MIRRLLIANRGEIAVRIIRACRELGIETIAVYSEVDARSPHVFAADRGVAIGPARAADSYLSIPAIIRAATTAGADAVHPGYGFLSENPQFAAACAEAGLMFVGPSAGVIQRMGSKIEARRLMEAAGVPVVPGLTPRDQSESRIVEAARRFGFPMLIKPSAGGGGKGMRVVVDDSELPGAVAAARREATAAFGDGTLYLERWLERPRHIEVQIIGDRHGHVVQLFERECSVQRRQQKMIEESPAPRLTEPLRARMAAAAVAAAEAITYENAGTVEFLVTGRGDDAEFYFLEMNTRLQVEHPVTEAVTGVDLVHAQLAVAGGDPLPWRQSDLFQRGHAIECRIYAEDPAGAFLPQAGRVLLYRAPARPWIRIDSGITEGTEVTVHYDPLLAKLIAYGETREIARARAVLALRAFPILGVRTNLTFLVRLLEDRRFQAGEVDTTFVEREQHSLCAPPDAWSLGAAASAAAVDRRATTAISLPVGNADPWTSLKNWRQ